MINTALSRRGLLSGAAGAALGTGVLTADSEASVLAGTRQGALPAKVDVVVVGAGIAGLVAAYVLSGPERTARERRKGGVAPQLGR